MLRTVRDLLRTNARSLRRPVADVARELLDSAEKFNKIKML